jgi:fimbrial isopeptide formation D2 family protein
MVTAAAPGTYINTMPVGALQTNVGGNTVAAAATLIVSSPVTVGPTLTKSFSPSTIAPGGTSTLTITMTNPNNKVATLTTPLTDHLPSGMVVSTTGSTNCGGTYSGKTGATSVTVSGGSIPANSSRTITVTVTAKSAGSYINTLPIGALQTSLGSNTVAASATLTVTAPVKVAPTLSKSFSPSTITTGGVSLLTITLSNASSTVAKMNASLTDNLPTHVSVSGKASTTCGGTVTAVSGSAVVTLTGGSIPANGSCNVTVDITADYEGTCINTIPVGALQTSNGSNAAKAVATLTVNASS